MKHIFQSLFSPKKHSEESGLSAFNRQRVETEDVQFIDHGITTMPLEDIIGSVGKYDDFDSQFRPRKHVDSNRFNSIKQAMREGKPIPPVKLYQIRNEYYVVDGNHRVAAAKELGWTEISAKVVELLSSENTMENMLYLERKKFYIATGLPEEIQLTEVGKYNYLESQIKKHQVFLAGQSGRDCDRQKAARDWYNTIYTPLATIIGNSGLLKYFPNRTVGDLYTYIAYHHWERSSNRRFGIGIDQLIPKSMEGFRKAMLEKKTPDYPEMKRSITAFVLVNTDPKLEYQIVDLLFDIEEIKEVHAVHGPVDLLVKAVIKRDLLASDAEVIAEFVEMQIRQLDGITRTQTMIPGLSKVKEGIIC